MESEFLSKNRILPLNDTPIARHGGYVLYWMQQSQRAQSNHALTYAVETANRLKQPVKVVFGFTPDYPEANLRHYTFMLEGLAQTCRTLAQKGIAMHIDTGPPPDIALDHGRRASLIVCDRGYLRHQSLWRQKVAANAGCRVVQVESDAIVPVETVSQKEEYAARTIRPKIGRLLDAYLQPVPEMTARFGATAIQPSPDFTRLKHELNKTGSITPVGKFMAGGVHEAKRRLNHFIENGLAGYAERHAKPEFDGTAMLSAYLHFGQISALEIVLAVHRAAADIPPDAMDAFLEELIVRRELALNFVRFNPRYDRYDGLPAWARKTLSDHRKDRRAPMYGPKALESAETHDPYWNAAMHEMKSSGFMHNYMRMYWGKKVLQWRSSPEKAYDLLLALNNKYFLDGRDPNSYAGVGWIFGLHDRAWQERPIFGKIRYMARSGLERKFNMQAYVDKVRERAAAL